MPPGRLQLLILLATRAERDSKEHGCAPSSSFVAVCFDAVHIVRLSKVDIVASGAWKIFGTKADVSCCVS